MRIWRKLAEFAHFETPRLVLRPFHFSDEKSFFQIVSDPENLDFIFPALSDKEVSDDLLVETFMRQPLGIWAIEDKRRKQLLGAIRFEKLDVEGRQAEIGYFLRKEYRKQGFMTEALRNIVFLAFYELGLREILLKTHAENKASQAVAQKVGFTAKRQYRGSDRYSRKTRHYIDFVLTASEFRLAEEEE
ncbi:GNAT family N-acetyltransferase [Streptococcus gallolyticus]|uniref:GNAT family N-acetyltransferase n=1 Tax=Streptococcus hepaticus TaxID=3349163 RepID=UPI001C96AB14|nr:GNAT family N-acetyltransferase [Streptococcus gallolyticus]MBY5040373.1 GNAT family N-acetyltransferase [Streptococcus gallolyticus]